MKNIGTKEQVKPEIYSVKETFHSSEVDQLSCLGNRSAMIIFSTKHWNISLWQMVINQKMLRWSESYFPQSYLCRCVPCLNPMVHNRYLDPPPQIFEDLDETQQWGCKKVSLLCSFMAPRCSASSTKDMLS